MAKGGGGKGGKGGGGKKTARSQNYLRQFGYPSARELRREAQGLAYAATPTVRQVSTPYNQQIRSTKDYLAAVQSALADTTAGVGQGYDASVAQSQGVDAAAQARLAGLGLGADSAGVQAAQGARGDSATQALIAQAASAKAAAAQNPAIAAGQASQFAQVTGNKLIDALANRRDALSQAFFQALSQTKSQHLAEAGFNQSQSQFTQNMALQQAQMAQQQSQFEAGQAQSAAAAAEGKKEFWARLHAEYGGQAGKSSQPWKQYNMTPTQYRAASTDANNGAVAAERQKVPPDVYLNRAIHINNIPPELALNAVQTVYGGLKGADPKKNPGQYQMYQLYQQWIQDNLDRQQLRWLNTRPAQKGRGTSHPANRHR